MELLLQGKPVQRVQYAHWLNSLLIPLTVLVPEPVKILINPNCAVGHSSYVLENRRQKIKAVLTKTAKVFTIVIHRLGVRITEDLTINDECLADMTLDHLPTQTVITMLKKHLCHPDPPPALEDSVRVTSTPQKDYRFYGGRITEYSEDEVMLESGLTFSVPALIEQCMNPRSKFLVISQSGAMKIFEERDFNQHFLLA